MTQFKVGDLVRIVDTGEVRFITFLAGQGVNAKEAEYVLDIAPGTRTGCYYREEEFELLGEQPNRTYYGGMQALRAANERDTENFTVEQDPFEANVHRILNGVAETVVQKNLSYGDSALNPIRVFSKADRMEQLFVRLDDKLSRVQRGSEYPGDDTLQDIIGYATLILIARESE